MNDFYLDWAAYDINGEIPEAVKKLQMTVNGKNYTADIQRTMKSKIKIDMLLFCAMVFITRQL